MKQKLIILLATLVLIAIAVLMVFDFYYKPKPVGNPWEYRLSEFRAIVEKDICYQKTAEINPQEKDIRGIAIDGYNNLLVTAKNAILRYDESGRLYKKIPLSGTPNCVAIEPGEKIFAGMADYLLVIQHNRIIDTISAPFNDKTFITSIAADATSLFVADAGNKIVYHFDHTGKLRNLIGERDSTGFKGFIIPSNCFDIALGREGQLWVVNPGKHELVAFNKQGTLISQWSRTSMQPEGFSGCCNPVNIAMLPDASFVTAEKGIERVKIHKPSGDYSCMVAAPDNFDEGTVGIDVAANASGKVYVLDPKKNLIHIFTKKTDLIKLP